MTDNPTAEKRFYKKLTKLIETGAVKFDAEPREVIAWFEKMWQRYTRQSPVTDEQLIEKVKKILWKYDSDKHQITGAIADEIISIVLNNDLQPKTDDWVSVDERKPKKRDGDEKGNVIIRSLSNINILINWKYAGQKMSGKFRYPFWQPLPLPPNTKNR